MVDLHVYCSRSLCESLQRRKLGCDLICSSPKVRKSRVDSFIDVPNVRDHIEFGKGSVGL